MNCQEFTDSLHDLLDHSLDARTEAAARAHLEKCGDCQRALRSAEGLATALRQSLDRATAGLSLRPDTRRTLRQALEADSGPANVWLGFWQRLLGSPFRLAASVAIVCVAVLLLRSEFIRHPSRDSVSAVAESGERFQVIDVPVQNEFHQFQRKDNMVVDAVAQIASAGHARLPENPHR
jgi:anti-sigma factor RsiW